MTRAMIEPESAPTTEQHRSSWDWSHLAKAACAVFGLVALTAAAHALFPGMPGQAYPAFLAAFVVVTLSAGRNVGFCAVGLSLLLFARFLVEGEGFAIHHPMEALGLFLFGAIGCALVAIVGRIQERRAEAEQASAQLRADGEAAVALMSELSHRVFNDLSSLNALALLQSRAAASAEAREALTDIAFRLEIFSGLYRRLVVDANRAGRLDMSRFLHDLCDDLRAARFGLSPIALKLEAERIRMPFARAVVVGLVVNEAVVNALKYAFPDERPGQIHVVFGRDPARPEGLRLTVTDDGIGPGEVASKGTGMGRKLISALAAQLQGDFALERRGGKTVASLHFSGS